MRQGSVHEPGAVHQPRPPAPSYSRARPRSAGAQSGVLPVPVDRALRERSASLPVCRPLPSLDRGRQSSGFSRQWVARRPAVFTSWPFTEQVCQPLFPVGTGDSSVGQTSGPGKNLASPAVLSVCLSAVYDAGLLGPGLGIVAVTLSLAYLV